MKPVQIEVFTPVPEAWGLCAPCAQVLDGTQGSKLQARSLDELPPDWQADLEQLSRLVLDLRADYGSRISVSFVDPRSLPGLVGALRHRIRRYPTFVVGGREKVTGLDRQLLDQALRLAGAAQEA
jgi:hypothetical protein